MSASTHRSLRQPPAELLSKCALHIVCISLGRLINTHLGQVVLLICLARLGFQTAHTSHTITTTRCRLGGSFIKILRLRRVKALNTEHQAAHTQHTASQLEWGFLAQFALPTFWGRRTRSRSINRNRARLRRIFWNFNETLRTQPDNSGFERELKLKSKRSDTKRV